MSAHLFVPRSVPRLSRDCPRWLNPVLTAQGVLCSFVRPYTPDNSEPPALLTTRHHTPNTAPACRPAPRPPCPSRTTTTLPIMAPGLFSHSIDLAHQSGVGLRIQDYLVPPPRTWPSTDPSCGSLRSSAYPFSFALALAHASTPVYTNKSIAQGAFECSFR